MSAERVSGDLGRKLREARERRGVSLRQIADRTKIAVSVLEGLERNDISRLPGGIFGRAFVRSFAHEIGLDPEATIQEFIVQFPQDSVTAGHRHSRSPQIVDNELLESDRRMASTVLRLIGLAVPIAVAVVYLSTVERGTESAAAARSAPPGATRSADPADIPVPRQGAVTDTRPTPPGADASAEDRVTVALTVTRPSWVSAVVDGETQVDRLLQPGEHRTLQIRRELVLTARDAGGVEVVVNGVAARPLGKDGEVVTKRLTPTNLAEFLEPR